MLLISQMKYLKSGECADIYEIDDKTVLKLGKYGWGKEVLYQEFTNGKLLNHFKIPSPKVYDFIEIDGRYGYTMEKLLDITVIDLMWKYPIKFIKYAKKMADIHATIHKSNVVDGLPTLIDKYQEFIHDKEGIDDNIKNLINKDIKQLYFESKHCICHGDFHPINIMVNNGEYFVIDWILASIGPAEADVAGTYLITKLYSSTTTSGNIFKRFISSIGGKIIAKTYLKEYISITGANKKQILKELLSFISSG